MLPLAFIHSVHLRHLFSSCWSLANQVQSISISINDFKTFYSHTHTSVLDMTSRIFMHGIAILCRIEYELLVSSLFFFFFYLHLKWGLEMANSPLGKERTPQDLHHGTWVTFSSDVHCQTDTKRSWASTKHIPSRFLSPRGDTMFRIDA